MICSRSSAADQIAPVLDQRAFALLFADLMSEPPYTLRPAAGNGTPRPAPKPLVERPARVSLHLRGEVLTAATGTLLLEVLPREIDGVPVVAAIMGQRPVSLTARATWDSELEAITIDTPEGQRIHRMSQALLLLEAAENVAQEADLRLAHSVGFGRRVLVGLGYRQQSESLATRIEAEMQRLVAERRPLLETWVSVSEATVYFERLGWDDTVDLLKTCREPIVPLASYGNIYALVMSPLLPDTGRVGGFRVIADRGGLLLLYGGVMANSGQGNGQGLGASLPPVATMENAEPVRPAVLGLRDVSNEEALAVSRQTLSMTQQQDRWLETLGIRSVGAFNRVSVAGHIGELINVSEGFHEKRISRIADEVHGRGRAARIVCIAGPSSSGKTTFIKRLRVQLQVLGMNPIAISLDDYYCDREQTPRDDQGQLDFECLEALRLELLQDHIRRLLTGETVKTAHYDFKQGLSDPSGGAEVRLDHRSVLMLEGIHGLNPELFAQIGQDEVFRVFICPLAQLPFDRVTRVHASDVRLIRRIVRDRHARGYSAADTITRWGSVRRGERRHIFPFQHHADAIFDSSLIYEIAVLKVYLERYLLEVPRGHSAWATAFRLLGLVDRFVSIYPDRVPPTSILREFLGGSSFQY